MCATGEKTTQLTRADIERMRRRTAVCSACGSVFFMEDDRHRACNMCVREAMEAESFVYKENNDDYTD